LQPYEIVLNRILVAVFAGAEVFTSRTSEFIGLLHSQEVLPREQIHAFIFLLNKINSISYPKALFQATQAKNITAPLLLALDHITAPLHFFAQMTTITTC